MRSSRNPARLAATALALAALVGCTHQGPGAPEQTTASPAAAAASRPGPIPHAEGSTQRAAGLSEQLTSTALTVRGVVLLGASSGPALILTALAQSGEPFGAHAWMVQDGEQATPVAIRGMPDGDLDSLAGASGEDLAVIAGTVLRDGAPRAFVLTATGLAAGGLTAWREVAVPDGWHPGFVTGTSVWSGRALVWGERLDGSPQALLITDGTAAALSLPVDEPGWRITAATGHGDEMLLAGTTPSALPVPAAFDDPVTGSAPGAEADRGVTSQLWLGSVAGGTWRRAGLPAHGEVGAGGLIRHGNDYLATGCLVVVTKQKDGKSRPFVPTNDPASLDNGSLPNQWTERPLCRPAVWRSPDGTKWRAERVDAEDRVADAEGMWLHSPTALPDDELVALATHSQRDTQELWRRDDAGTWRHVAGLPAVGTSSPTGTMAVHGSQLLAASAAGGRLVAGKLDSEGVFDPILTVGETAQQATALRAFTGPEGAVISGRLALLVPVYGANTVETRPDGTFLTLSGATIDYAHWSGLNLDATSQLRYSWNRHTDQEVVTGRRVTHDSGHASTWLRDTAGGTWSMDYQGADLGPSQVITSLSAPAGRWLAAVGDTRITPGQSHPVWESRDKSGSGALPRWESYPEEQTSIPTIRMCHEAYGGCVTIEPPDTTLPPDVTSTVADACELADGNWLLAGGVRTTANKAAAAHLWTAETGWYRGGWPTDLSSKGIAACATWDSGSSAAKPQGVALLDEDGRRIHLTTDGAAVRTLATLPEGVRLSSLVSWNGTLAAGGEERTADYAGPIVALSEDGSNWRRIRLAGSMGMGHRTISLAVQGEELVAVQVGSSPPAAWILTQQESRP